MATHVTLRATDPSSRSGACETRTCATLMGGRLQDDRFTDPFQSRHPVTWSAACLAWIHRFPPDHGGSGVPPSWERSDPAGHLSHGPYRRELHAQLLPAASSQYAVASGVLTGRRLDRFQHVGFDLEDPRGRHDSLRTDLQRDLRFIPDLVTRRTVDRLHRRRQLPKHQSIPAECRHRREHGPDPRAACQLGSRLVPGWLADPVRLDRSRWLVPPVRDALG